MIVSASPSLQKIALHTAGNTGGSAGFAKPRRRIVRPQKMHFNLARQLIHPHRRVFMKIALQPRVPGQS